MGLLGARIGIFWWYLRLTSSLDDGLMPTWICLKHLRLLKNSLCFQKEELCYLIIGSINSHDHLTK